MLYLNDVRALNKKEITIAAYSKNDGMMSCKGMKKGEAKKIPKISTFLSVLTQFSYPFIYPYQLLMFIKSYNHVASDSIFGIFLHLCCFGFKA